MTKPNIVTDESIERALDWLRDNADEIGAAKHAAVKSEHMLRHHKAIAMKLSGEKNVSAQEREAYASEAYGKAIDTCADAAGHYEKLKALREAAALRIEVWRSSSANYRAMKI